MNNLSRNKPVAFVVGASGFIGSHLCEQLLEKGIQVIGSDNFTSGKREYITESSKNKDFHLISQSLLEIASLEFPRLDYAFFMITEDLDSVEYENTFKKFLSLCASFSPKVILCSSVNLYDEKQESLANLKFAEKELAKSSLDNKVNARIVRLSSIFGPRMHFRDSDPMTRLIKSAVQNKLNESQTPLEFTTRALFIHDAVSLLIKAVMHGFTAQKIYDGCALDPIKVSEIKQVLLDPVWYEEKGFVPTQLPPWTTPNLNKTTKELSWRPATNIINALKETLIYFKEHPQTDFSERVEEKKPTTPWQYSKFEEEAQNPIQKKKQKEGVKLLKINAQTVKHKFISALGITIVFFALVFPILKFIVSGFEVNNHLKNSINQTAQGNFEKALAESQGAVGDAQYLTNAFAGLSVLKQLGPIKTSYEAIEQSLILLNKAVSANLHTVSGAKYLANGLAVISGEKTGDSIQLLMDAKSELAGAGSEIGQVSASLNDKNFTDKIPAILKPELGNLESKINSYSQTINLGKSLTDLLPQIIAVDGEKSYLVILQDNRSLRPGGGVIRSYVEVTFNNGKLKGIKGDMVENLDKSFSGKIDPPTELKNDLGIANWRMSDASFDPDFPISASNIAWFYSKESGTKVFGVIALDLVSLEKLQNIVSLSTDVSSKIALTREGNQVSADVLKELVERIFYLSKQNWVGLAQDLSESLNQKHLLLYLTDPNSFSYLASRNWTGGVPKQINDLVGERSESLMLSETNMTLGQDSTNIERAINIESKLDASGIISHKLTLTYTASEKLIDIYKNRLKIYLPIGTKMIKTTWGNTILKNISPFSDYGMSGYSMLLDLGVGEQKQLVLEYQDTTPAKFENNQLKYSLNIIKQVGQTSIPVDFKLIIPEGIRAESSLQNGVGEVTVKSQLSQDLNFEVTLYK